MFPLTGKLDVAVRLGALIAGGYGVVGGARAWEQESRRVLHALAGFIVFHVLGRLLIAAYLLGNAGGQIWLLSPATAEAMAGWMGLLLGGSWLAAGQTLLRGGFGALLGLYLANVVSFIWPSPGELAEELQLGLLAIVAASSVFPLISVVPVRGMIRAVSAALPGVVLMQFFHLNSLSGDEWFFTRVSLLSFLLSLPLAGIAHTRLASSGTVSFSIPAPTCPYLKCCD